MRKTGYLISIVGLLLIFAVKVGGANRDRRRLRVVRMWDHKREDWLRHLPV
jgi:hypothetical protein